MATRFLSLAEVLDLYSRVLLVGGGSSAIRDLGALESALAQPRATFDGVELYPTLVDKSAALGFSLIRNHTAAVAVWGRSWTDADTTRSSTLIKSLDDLDRLLGGVQGYDLVKSFEVGPSVLNLYLIVRYEKQPLFAFFALYRPKSEWQVNAVTWNTDAAAVFPSSLLTPR
ncbi:MAG TPA: Fic family protein [Gemmatimonadaceae bacterium]|nr:Fic family protein [Gemmatimonadaceae bacterium]